MRVNLMFIIIMKGSFMCVNFMFIIIMKESFMRRASEH